MKRPIRLLALDLDGTVLNGEKHISPATRAALEAAIAAGVTVVPATGRPLSGLSQEFLDIPGVGYALTSNGAAVYRLSDGAVLHADYLDTETAARLMEGLQPLTLIPSCFSDGRCYVTRRQQALLPQLTNVSPAVREYLRTSRIVVEDCAALLRRQGRAEKLSLNFLPDGPEGPDGAGWRDHAQVRAVLAAYPTLSVVSGGTRNLEVTSPTANKGAGLLALAAHLGIPREQVMACGDSENDLAMLDAAGFAVAMANGEDCIFSHADAVTDTNDNDGVAQAIRAYIL